MFVQYREKNHWFLVEVTDVRQANRSGGQDTFTFRDQPLVG